MRYVARLSIQPSRSFRPFQIRIGRLSSSLKFSEVDLVKESFSVLAIKLPSLPSKVA